MASNAEDVSIWWRHHDTIIRTHKAQLGKNDLIGEAIRAANRRHRVSNCGWCFKSLPSPSWDIRNAEPPDTVYALPWRHMSVMASQITDKATVCSTGCSVYHQGKYKIFALLALCEGNPSVTIGSPSQRASDAEHVPISWCHHGPTLWNRCQMNTDIELIILSNMPLTLNTLIKTLHVHKGCQILIKRKIYF